MSIFERIRGTGREGLVNPLTEARENIKAYDALFNKTAGDADMGRIQKQLKDFQTDLMQLNSQISIKVVARLQEKNLIKEAAQSRDLHLQHNAKYRDVRNEAKSLANYCKDVKPAETRGAMKFLSEEDKNYIYTKLLNIALHISDLQNIWDNLAPYERIAFGGRA